MFFSATMNALKETSKALKQYGRTVDVASVDHLLNNLEDATDFAEDLNNEYERDAVVDMSAVEEELEAMLQDPEISTDLSVPVLPAPPSSLPMMESPSSSSTLNTQQPSSTESERSQLLAHMAL